MNAVRCFLHQRACTIFGRITTRILRPCRSGCNSSGCETPDARRSPEELVSRQRSRQLLESILSVETIHNKHAQAHSVHATCHQHVQIHDAAHHPHACDHTVPGVANMIANIANCDQRVALLLLSPPLRKVSSCSTADTAATEIAKVAMGNVLSHASQAGDQMRIAWVND